MTNLFMTSCALLITNLPLYTLTVVNQSWLQPGTSSVNVAAHAPAISRLPLNAREIIGWLRKEGLPMSTIADIARVERKSVYAWMNNGQVRPQNHERLEKLYQMLSENEQTPLLHVYRFWKRILSNGKSLGSLLTAEHLDYKAIRKALVEIQPLAKKAHYVTSQAQKPQQNKSNPFLDDIGEAALSDE